MKREEVVRSHIMVVKSMVDGLMSGGLDREGLGWALSRRGLDAQTGRMLDEEMGT